MPPSRKLLSIPGQAMGVLGFVMTPPSGAGNGSLHWAISSILVLIKNQSDTLLGGDLVDTPIITSTCPKSS